MAQQEAWCSGEVQVFNAHDFKVPRTKTLKLLVDTVQAVPDYACTRDLKHGQLRAFANTIMLMGEIKKRVKRY
jgi:hypothetical protein